MLIWGTHVIYGFRYDMKILAPYAYTLSICSQVGFLER